MAYPTDPIYKLGKNPLTGVVDQVTKESNGTKLIIPFVDANADKHTVNVEITFRVVNQVEPVTLNLILERVR